MTSNPAFARKLNRDSSIDSICTRCFQTIATAAREGELAIHEEEHICDPYEDFGSLNINSDLRAREDRNPEGNIERAD